MIEVLEVAGIYRMTQAMRSSYKSESDSRCHHEVDIGPKDMALIKSLIKAGDSHAKAFRLPVIYFKLTAPLSFWHHFDTYRYDVFVPNDSELEFDFEGCSESTMHTLVREIKAEIKGNATFASRVSSSFGSRFSNSTYIATIIGFLQAAQECRFDVEIMRDNLPWGFLQSRTGRMSYMAARRIWQDRHNHRLSSWQTFCAELVEQVPYSELLMFEEAE